MIAQTPLPVLRTLAVWTVEHCIIHCLLLKDLPCSSEAYLTFLVPFVRARYTRTSGTLPIFLLHRYVSRDSHLYDGDQHGDYSH